MAETKIIYHLDEQDTPYLVKIPIAADRVTLLDLKNALNRPNYKYFFKSIDDDFGVVKEEILDDSAVLPSFNGRVVTWLVGADCSVTSEGQFAETSVAANVSNVQRTQQIGEAQKKVSQVPKQLLNKSPMTMETNTETKKGYSSRGHVSSRQKSSRHYKPVSSVMSSDIETTSFIDSEDDASTRISTTTDNTNPSSRYHRHASRSRRRYKTRPQVMSQASSFSSITDSTMSLNIITVTLNMESSSFLGISIVGQSSKGGDGGIYVGSIMKGGAVAQDGRIEPGDMLLEVNGTSFENMSNDEAVRTLREAVQRSGPISLVLAKCWDPNPKGYFTIPRHEPARPIDPSAWLLHTQAAQGMWDRGMAAGPPSMSTITSSSSSLVSSVPPGNEFGRRRFNHSSVNSSSSHSSRSYTELNKNADMATIIRAMSRPDSGLEVRDRMWLKITIPQSFIGSDLVDWLHMNVDGFTDRRDARRYACNLLQSGYIQHTVNKLTFSEQCYYIFGNIAPPPPSQLEMAALSINDIDSVSSAGHDVISPLPPPPQVAPPYLVRPPHGIGYQTHPTNYSPSAPYNFITDAASYISMPGMNGAESVISGSAKRDQTCACIVTHTYKQFRKLWDNTDKSNPGSNPMKMTGKFDADIDRSTSSDTGSSDAEEEQGGGRGGGKDKKDDNNKQMLSTALGSRQLPPLPSSPNEGIDEKVEEMGDL